MSNDRIVGFDSGIVRFRWKDHRDHGRVKVMSLPAAGFLRRFLVHVLPEGFVRIRHYGLLANRTRGEKLGRCRELLAVAAVPASLPEPTERSMLRLTGEDIERCPVCREGRMRIVATIVAELSFRKVSPWNTS